LGLHIDNPILNLWIINCRCYYSSLHSTWVIVHHLSLGVHHRSVLLLKLGVNSLILLRIHLLEVWHRHPHLSHLWRQLELGNLHLTVWHAIKHTILHRKPILTLKLCVLWLLIRGRIHTIHRGLSWDMHTSIVHLLRNLLFWRLLLGSA